MEITQSQMNMMKLMKKAQMDSNTAAGLLMMLETEEQTKSAVNSLTNLKVITEEDIVRSVVMARHPER